METTRQSKIARHIQRDMGEIFLTQAAPLLKGVIATVTAVRMSPDLGYAKILVSVFPFERSQEVMERLEANNWMLRKALAARLRHQLKSVPELKFLLDDSLEYIDNIDHLLKEE